MRNLTAILCFAAVLCIPLIGAGSASACNPVASVQAFSVGYSAPAVSIDPCTGLPVSASLRFNGLGSYGVGPAFVGRSSFFNGPTVIHERFGVFGRRTRTTIFP